ncbi:MAG: DUF3326 domain-containing protein [Cyanobacteria bacterium]|nr:DUF3326 domain-containing protein [Cyanobacteriota bacterium]
MNTKPLVTAVVIPTGIGASIGGYAGDAGPALKAIASVSDYCITHPNVSNAAIFQTLPENGLYVEGYALDRFFMGEWALHLHPSADNRLGVVFDAGIEPAMRQFQDNVLAATAQSFGLKVVAVESTPEPVQLSLTQDTSGATSGLCLNPETIFTACERVISRGANALAICCRMPEETPDLALSYARGRGVDPIGGIEAMLSHAVVARYQLPAAHAPVFSLKDALDTLHQATQQALDPRLAAEWITMSYLPCILQGLARAPQYQIYSESCSEFLPETLSIQDLAALVVPSNALGGLPVLACAERKIPIIAVADNTTVMKMTAKALPPSWAIHTVQTYAEAAAWLNRLIT